MAVQDICNFGNDFEHEFAKKKSPELDESLMFIDLTRSYQYQNRNWEIC